MAVPSRNRSRKKGASGSRIAVLVFVALIAGAVIGYFWRSPSRKAEVTPQQPALSRVSPAIPDAPAAKPPATHPPVASPPPVKEQPVYPPTEVPEPDKAGGSENAAARVAIIIDDMGSSLAEARSLAAIKVPLTFSIIPGLRSDKDVAAFAAAQKIETMIHIPMQSKGWPERRLEANGLLVGMKEDELQERVAGFVERFPGAAGVNNHMGSEFTEHEDKMTVVLQALKKNNLFFIDSVTSPQSAGLRVAQRLGIRSARRNVFLDNEQERGYILGQLAQAVKQARKNGSAIAICHPHPATITALAAALPGLSAQGVRLVPASQLVR
jgi:polysaccharide deacetylase 2 family uncharacterized protein YibQ